MSSDISQRVADRLLAHFVETGDEQAIINLFSPDGLAESIQYRECEDGHIIERTKTPLRGGKLDGYYGVFVFAPVGKGSRSGRGKASRWHRVKTERCKTRKESIQRAEALWYEHCPKLAAKHGKLTGS